LRLLPSSTRSRMIFLPLASSPESALCKACTTSGNSPSLGVRSFGSTPPNNLTLCRVSRREHPLVGSCSYVFVRCRVQAESYPPVAGAEWQKYKERSSGMLGDFLALGSLEGTDAAALPPLLVQARRQRTFFNLARQGTPLLLPCLMASPPFFRCPCPDPVPMRSADRKEEHSALHL